MVNLGENKTVSIIMPMYNAEFYIEQTIQSVLAQSYQDWELLITDDCSKDNSTQLVKRYVEQDSRIKLLSNTKNQGPAESRNHSISKASGRFLAFLDSDDSWLPTKLEQQVNFMLDNQYAFSFTQFRRFKDDLSLIGHCIDISDKIDYNGLLKNTTIATSTVMLDTSLIKIPIKMKRVYYDDFVLWLEILKTGVIAYGLQEDLMRYRVLQNSVSRNKLESAKQVWFVYRNIEKLNFLYSAWNFIHYSLNSVIKYAKF